MAKSDIIAYAQKYSQGINSSYSPWKSNFDDMAKKTVIKRVLKYAPMKAEFARAVASDETIKTQISIDMTEIQPEEYIDADEIATEGGFEE